MSDLIFVSMPYSHPDPAVVRDRMVLFSKMMGQFALKGETVVSPLVFHFMLEHTPALGSDWAFWENYSKHLLGRSTRLRVIMAPGWRESSGVTGEIEHAKLWGVRVEYVEPVG